MYMKRNSDIGTALALPSKTGSVFPSEVDSTEKPVKFSGKSMPIRLIA